MQGHKGSTNDPAENETETSPPNRTEGKLHHTRMDGVGRNALFGVLGVISRKPSTEGQFSY